MLGAYHNKEIRPPLDPRSVREWWGWRRLKGRHGYAAWEHFAEADAPTQGECYQRLMDRSELAAHDGQYEYMILPAKEVPEIDTGRGFPRH